MNDGTIEKENNNCYDLFFLSFCPKLEWKFTTLLQNNVFIEGAATFQDFRHFPTFFGGFWQFSEFSG